MHVSKPGASYVAAVVGSCDMSFVQYPASLGFLEAGKEVRRPTRFLQLNFVTYTVLQTIVDVKKKMMMIQRMKEYKDHMKGYPQRVIVFRGAASESNDAFDQGGSGRTLEGSEQTDAQAEANFHCLHQGPPILLLIDSPARISIMEAKLL